MLGIDLLKVVSKQTHADPLPPVIWVGTQQRQVIVRLSARVGGIESANQLQVGGSSGTKAIRGQIRQALLLPWRHLCAAGRDPDGDGLPTAGHPSAGVSQCPLHKYPPEHGVMRRTATGECHRMCPQRVARERTRDDRADSVSIS